MPNDDKLIRLEDIANAKELLQKRRNRSDTNRLIGSILLALAFQFVGQLLGGDMKGYFWNVSAGFYAAGLAYWLIEKGHQKNRAELETLEKLATHTYRMMQVSASSETRFQNIEKTQEHLTRFHEKIQHTEGREKLKYEYLSWQMQMQLLYEFTVLKQEITEHIELIKNMRGILVDLQKSAEIDRLDTVIRALQQKLSKVETMEKANGDAMVNMTVDLHERFIGPVEKQ
ncbi:MAG: hypothetical protein GC179_30575 [Anaerolineaceae bacterium]|nr:hypothetical protein [Anaerolineaceae bacterium]